MGRASATSRRRVPLLLAAIALALAGALGPIDARVARAAADGLDLTTAATYSVVPARHLVHVVVVITAVNNKPNVSTGGLITKYFYDGARIGIQTEAQAIRATSGGAPLIVTTTAADGYRILEVRFRSSLFYHETARVDVAFDLPGGAPRSRSAIRVGSAFTTFVAWAFGDQASVSVVVPAGFQAETTGSDAVKSASRGTTVFRAAGITDVNAWYLVVNADRQAALTSQRLDLAGGEHVVIRAWPEDAAWKTQVGKLLERGLPALVADTGLAWPVSGDLSIFEVHTPLLEGYAGVFLEGQDKIEISEDLDDLTILHEASHAWFNSDLFDGRWIDEGFADTYAARTLATLGVDKPTPPTVSPSDPAAVRLSSWTFPGRISDAATNAREQFGYDASWTVIRSLVGDVGANGMQRVLAAAEAHQIAYVGGGSPEPVTGPTDWRRFLDLLDETGRSRIADDVFRRWVVTDAEAASLDERAAARTAWTALVAAGREWTQPFYVRSALADWSFAAARQRMTEATAVLAQRDDIAARSADLGVAPPPDLRLAYESATNDLSTAAALATREQADLVALGTAADAIAAPRAPLVALGLMGSTPEAGLADARTAFAAGAADAGQRAAAVTATIDGAVEIGRGRLLAAIVGLVVGLALLVLAAVVIRRRRGLRRALARAGEAPYVTLADQSDRSLATGPIPSGSTAWPGPEPVLMAGDGSADPRAESAAPPTEPPAPPDAPEPRDPIEPTGPPPAAMGDAP